MYQLRILKTMVGNQEISHKDFRAIARRAALVIPKPENRQLFDVMAAYYNKFSQSPSWGYLDDCLDLAKGSAARGVYDSLKDPGVHVFASKNELMAYVDMQVSWAAKSMALEVGRQYDAKLKVADLESVDRTLMEMHEDVQKIHRAMMEQQGDSRTLFGEESIRLTKQEYEEVEKTKGNRLAMFGVGPLDDLTDGIRTRDFMVIAAYTSQGKSTFTRFLVYNFLMQGVNVFFHTFEMDFGAVRDFFHCLHANNTRIWGFDKPKITYRAIRNGTLTPEQKDFFLNQVVPDFQSNQNYGNLHIAQPEADSWTFEDSWAEMMEVNQSEFPVDIYVADYMTLMRPHSRSRLEREDYNLMIHLARLLGLSKNIAVITPHQCNRESYNTALKDKEHRYNLTCMSDYNAMERFSTLAMTLFHNDEMKASSKSQIQVLKHREGDTGSPFIAMVDPSIGWYFFQGVETVETPQGALDILGSLHV